MCRSGRKRRCDVEELGFGRHFEGMLSLDTKTIAGPLKPPNAHTINSTSSTKRHPKQHESHNETDTSCPYGFALIDET